MGELITTNEPVAKAKSKNEIYYLQATEGKIYLLQWIR